MAGRGSELTKGDVRRIQDRVLKAAGKPRNGPIFAKRQSCRLPYRKRLDSQMKLIFMLCLRIKFKKICEKVWSTDTFAR